MDFTLIFAPTPCLKNQLGNKQNDGNSRRSNIQIHWILN